MSQASKTSGAGRLSQVCNDIGFDDQSSLERIARGETPDKLCGDDYVAPPPKPKVGSPSSFTESLKPQGAITRVAPAKQNGAPLVDPAVEMLRTFRNDNRLANYVDFVAYQLGVETKALLADPPQPEVVEVIRLAARYMGFSFEKLANVKNADAALGFALAANDYVEKQRKLPEIRLNGSAYTEYNNFLKTLPEEQRKVLMRQPQAVQSFVAQQSRADILLLATVLEPRLCYEIFDPLIRHFLVKVRAEFAGKKGFPAEAADRLISFAFVKGILTQESRGYVAATSASGAMGLMQLMPNTAVALGLDAPADAYMPTKGIEAGVRYLFAILEIYAAPTVWHRTTDKKGRIRKICVKMKKEDYGVWLKTAMHREDLLAAGYNAGPNGMKVRKGKPATRETRTYMKHVPLFSEIFRLKENGAALSPREGR